MRLTNFTFFPLMAITLAGAAQTAHTTHHTATHTTTHARTHEAAHETARAGGCVAVPALSPKIPALAADAPCPKVLYTLTRKPDVELDYASPLLSEATREALSPKPVSVSLVYVDTKVGTGPLAEPHKWYTVNYTGYLPDGTKFDSSYDRKEPISFPYGQHRVIAGWDTGFEGMHVGGTRRLYVPYQLAYGEQGRPPVIPAKSELIFDVELVSESDTPPPPPAAKPQPAAPGHASESPEKPEPPANKPQANESAKPEAK